MSDKQIDLSEYLQVLQQFKAENTEEVMKYWGSMEAYDDFMKYVKEKESDIARVAIKQYGSIEKYTEAMKENMSNFAEIMEKLQNLKPKVDNYVKKNHLLMHQLVKDLSRDVNSKEIQDIVKEIIELSEIAHPEIDKDEDYWNLTIDGYLHNEKVIEANDQLYGSGASEFMGRAFQCYFMK